MEESIKARIQSTVNQLYAKNGQVTAVDLVTAAKPKDSPAHDGFEWDNKIAGNEYRLIQSRQWLRKVKIIVEDRSESLVHVPCVVMKTDDGGEVERSAEGYYKPISVVIRNSDELERAINAVHARLNSAKLALLQLTAMDGARDRVDLDRASEGFAIAMDALGMGSSEMAEVL